jgi:hypothetical protein
MVYQWATYQLDIYLVLALAGKPFVLQRLLQAQYLCLDLLGEDFHLLASASALEQLGLAF